MRLADGEDDGGCELGSRSVTATGSFSSATAASRS
jgi:hypothetical protein